jgi:streptomycin 6-kinase
MLDIPTEFARHTIDREGEPGRAWIDRLPRLLDTLLRQWELTPDGPLLHGAVGVIAPVRRADGTPAVMKVSLPHPGNVHEPDAFTVWAGHGALHLYEREDAHYAMLLERVHQDTLDTEPDVETAIAAAGLISRRLAVPAPAGLPRLSEQAEGWEEELRKDAAQLPRPLPRYVVDTAAATLRELGRSQPEVMVHGDLHFGNVLRAEREPWLAIDPKGEVGDPAYDTFTVIRSRGEELLAADDLKAAVLRRVAVFAEASGLDRERAHRWAHYRTVRDAHWGRRYDAPDWLVETYDHLATILL